MQAAGVRQMSEQMLFSNRPLHSVQQRQQCGELRSGAVTLRPYVLRFGTTGRTKGTQLRSQAVGSNMAPELKAAVEEFLTKHKVVLFMKGNRQFPQCGFSNTCVQILNVMGVPYETVNILEDESLRSGMKEFSQWPTFPQIYINNEFFGGCDIMIESYQDGSLKETLEVAVNS